MRVNLNLTQRRRRNFCVVLELELGEWFLVSRKGKGGKIFESIFDFIRTSIIGSHFSNVDFGLQQKVPRKFFNIQVFGKSYICLFWFFFLKWGECSKIKIISMLTDFFCSVFGLPMKIKMPSYILLPLKAFSTCLWALSNYFAS